MKLVTHDGKFHTDDVFASAILTAIYPDAELIRSRDPKVIDAGSIVYDVGGQYDPTTERYDHHMTVEQGAPVRSTGGKYSSVGLIWRFYHHEFITHCLGDTRGVDFPAVFQAIDQIIATIDAVDNGEYFVLQPISIFDVISTLSHANEFDLAVEVAYKYLRTKVIYEAERISIRKRIDEAWTNRFSDHTLIVSEGPVDGEYVYDSYPSVLFIIQSKPDGSHRLSCVTRPNSFENKRDLPKEWLDPLWFRDNGIQDMRFVHPGLFTAGFGSLETVTKMAKYAAGEK
jgi:uncharacterized UPF0160 family protein